MINELKPCPFCGGGTHYYAPAPIDHHIQCEKCFAETGGFSSKEEAIEAWNTRAERTCKPLYFEYGEGACCSECGRRLHYDEHTESDYPPYCGCGAKVVE